MKSPVNTSVIDRKAITLVTVADLRRQLNLYDDTSQDEYLGELLKVIFQWAEDFTGLKLAEQVIFANYDGFDNSGLVLPSKYVVAVASLGYYDSNNDIQTVDSSNYILDITGNQGILKTLPNVFTPPQLSTMLDNPVNVTYVVKSNVPANNLLRFKQAILIGATSLYLNRSNTNAEGGSKVYFSPDVLLRQFRSFFI